MKKNYIIILFLLISFGFSACVNLDTYPEGETITDDMREDVISKDPARIQADINGLYAKLIEYRVTYEFDSSRNDYDFGYPGLAMALDHSGTDIVADDTGYNYFRYWANLSSSRNYTSTQAYFPWILLYSHIRIANKILLAVPEEDLEAEPGKAAFRGQALVSRAFDYLMLVQLYQFTYIGHENELAVPIVTEFTTLEEITNNPRATVETVYQQIIKDLNNGIELLEGFRRADKSAINTQVAYGLRARVNLLMEKWDDAAADAEKAMAGYTPYSIQDVSKPSFYTAEAPSWIWANIITSSNDVALSGIINWPSFLCSFTGNGYTTGTDTYVRIYKPLWEKIPVTDVRKGWWVDETLSSPLSDDILYGDMKLSEALDWPPYTNVKFAAEGGIPLSADNSQDWPMMRVEEMILIKAEAEAMGSAGLATAKQTLENFVKTYRDPEYTSTATSKDEFRDEVWFQRRVELWAEGFAFLDIMRLKKPVKRFEAGGNTNHPSSLIYDLPAEHGSFLMRLPEAEITANAGIPESANNPSVPKPNPVTPN